MKVNDIVTIVAQSGEYVGKVKERSPLTITNPRMIIRNPENGEMGFARGIAVTGEESPSEVLFNEYIFVVPTNQNVKNAFQEATGELITPDSKIVT